MKKILETTVNIVLLVTCVAVLGTIVADVVGNQQRQARERGERPIQAGHNLSSIAGFRPSTADQSLLLFVRSDCKFCAESLAFYRRLSGALSQENGRAVQLVVASSEPTEVTETYLTSNGVKASSIISVSPTQQRALRIPGTPTLLLVDRAGVVQNVWFGKLDTPHEAEVLKMLFPET